MRLRELLKIESVVDKRAVPSDMIEMDIEYYSESKQQHIDIMDMHLVHFIRAFVKMDAAANEMKYTKPEIIEVDGAQYKRLPE